ncbi:MAG: hypothetical protein H6988_11590 [Pseudomonadales bacterium]|nr:hypothetical protein [Pseudomonadales bacterium]
MRPPIGTMQTGPVLDQARTQPATEKAVPPHKCAEAVVQRQPAFIAIGQQLAVKAINGRALTGLDRYVHDANSETQSTAAAGLNVLLGFCTVAAEAIAKGQAAGHFRLVNGLPCSGHDLEYSFSTGRARFIGHYEAIVRTLQAVFGQCRTLHISLREKDKATPQEVKITSLPDRKTTSTIQRDSNGNVASSTQLESDA